MRAILLIIIVAILLLIAALATGFLDINQMRGARAPAGQRDRQRRHCKGGQAPAFQVETGSIKVGTKEAKVKVPTLRSSRAGNQAAQAAANDADELTLTAAAGQSTQPMTFPAAPADAPRARSRARSRRGRRSAGRRGRHLGERSIAEARNAMRGSTDPTAHAEMEAIRAAARRRSAPRGSTIAPCG